MKEYIKELDKYLTQREIRNCVELNKEQKDKYILVFKNRKKEKLRAKKQRAVDAWNSLSEYEKRTCIFY